MSESRKGLNVNEELTRAWAEVEHWKAVARDLEEKLHQAQNEVTRSSERALESARERDAARVESARLLTASATTPCHHCEGSGERLHIDCQMHICRTCSGTGLDGSGKMELFRLRMVLHAIQGCLRQSTPPEDLRESLRRIMGNPQP